MCAECFGEHQREKPWFYHQEFTTLCGLNVAQLCNVDCEGQRHERTAKTGKEWDRRRGPILTPCPILAMPHFFFWSFRDVPGPSPFNRCKNRGTKTSSYLCVVTQPVHLRTRAGVQLLPPPESEHWSRGPVAGHPRGRGSKGRQMCREDSCQGAGAVEGTPVVLWTINESKDRMCDLAEVLRQDRVQAGNSGCRLSFMFPGRSRFLGSLPAGRPRWSISVLEEVPSTGIEAGGLAPSLYSSLSSFPLPCSGKGSVRECGQVAPEIYIWELKEHLFLI